jgi:hypothetical protein
MIEARTHVDRSPGEVFDYASDPTHEPEWNPRTRRVVKLTAGPPGVGARYEMEFIPGRPVAVECVAYDPPATWAQVGRSLGLTFSWKGQVLSAARGSDLILKLEIEPHGLSRVLAPLVSRRMRSELPHHVRSLASVLAR